MKRTWIGHHKPINIGLMVKPCMDTSSHPSETSLGDRRKRALVFVYILVEGAHAHVQKVPLEWFLSTPGLGVVPRLMSKI